MIKQLEDSQIEEVMGIWLKTTISAHSFIPKEYWIENYNFVKNKYIPSSKTFIYKEDGKIQGFISIVEESFIGALFVAKDHQRQGIGKMLLNYCKSIYKSLDLCVYVENINAVNFYKSCGFNIKKEQKNDDSGFIEYLMLWES
ncbi:N-acetyltransferase [Clostridium carnis]